MKTIAEVMLQFANQLKELPGDKIIDGEMEVSFTYEFPDGDEYTVYLTITKEPIVA